MVDAPNWDKIELPPVETIHLTSGETTQYFTVKCDNCKRGNKVCAVDSKNSKSKLCLPCKTGKTKCVREGVSMGRKQGPKGTRDLTPAAETPRAPKRPRAKSTTPAATEKPSTNLLEANGITKKRKNLDAEDSDSSQVAKKPRKKVADETDASNLKNKEETKRQRVGPAKDIARAITKATTSNAKDNATVDNKPISKAPKRQLPKAAAVHIPSDSSSDDQASPEPSDQEKPKKPPGRPRANSVSVVITKKPSEAFKSALKVASTSRGAPTTEKTEPVENQKTKKTTTKAASSDKVIDKETSLVIAEVMNQVKDFTSSTCDLLSKLRGATQGQAEQDTDLSDQLRDLAKDLDAVQSRSSLITRLYLDLS